MSDEWIFSDIMRQLNKLIETILDINRIIEYHLVSIIINKIK